MTKYKKIDSEKLIELYEDGRSDGDIADIFNCNERTIRRRLTKLREEGAIDYRSTESVFKENAKLEKQTQRYRDLVRIDRKKYREHVQLTNAIEAYNKELVHVFSQYKLPAFTKKKLASSKQKIAGIIHITDTHFNELVDMPNNKYDFIIAAKRLKLMAEKSKVYFKSLGIKKVLIALTGDLLNSDRRLDELLSEATNRSKATFLGVNILEQFILDLAQDFDLSIASVIGNESRITKDVGWTENVASDNYDYTIFHILKMIFRNSNIKFLDGDSVENIIEVANQNILLLHGNQIKPTSMEQSIQKIKGKYTSRNIRIDFILSGHLHSTRIGDSYARGSSLVGSNAYSDSALQLEGRAAQNLHIIYANGLRDSIKVDLQSVDNIKGYDIVKELEAYNAKSLKKAKAKRLVVNIVG